MKTSRYAGLLAMPLAVLTACGGPPPPAPVAPAAATPVDQTEPASPPVSRVEQEPEIPLEDRWRAPFAVSSSGRTAPREPRRVEIIGADPAIAEALVDLRIGPASATSETPPAGEPDASDALDQADAPDDEEGSAGRTRSPEEDRQRGEARPEIITHRVGPGDTLWGIARRYNVSIEAIRALNDLESERVRLGQTLRIPTDDGS